MELICKMSPKIRLICKWVPNLPQIIRKWTSFANESQFICKWVLICKWGVSSTWVMNSFANEYNIDSFANESWLICKQGFICKWVLNHLQMNHLSGLQTSLSRQHFFCSTSCHNDLLPKIISRHIKKTHTLHITSHIHQTPSPWWCCLLLQQHGCGKSSSPTPGSLFISSRTRAIFMGLFNLADRLRKKY